MAFKSSENPVPMSASAATAYVRRMVELEIRGSGDTEGALRRLEARYGLPYWTLWHLRRGAAKTVEAGLFGRIRGAYLTYCEEQVAALQHELFLEKAANPDVDLEDLDAEAEALAAKVAAARRRIGGRK